MNLEKKVYIINVTDDKFTIPDATSIYNEGGGSLEEFINISEEQCNVYSINGFIEAFNEGRINSNTDIIRII